MPRTSRAVARVERDQPSLRAIVGPCWGEGAWRYGVSYSLRAGIAACTGGCWSEPGRTCPPPKRGPRTELEVHPNGGGVATCQRERVGPSGPSH
eukprot:1053859-Pyramimonas_sp.AAC.1